MAKETAAAGERLVNPWRIMGWSFAAGLLLLPLVAMRFTDEVQWTAFDFAFAATIIGGVGMVFELAVRRSRDHAYRAGVGIALAAAFLLVWINGAVGIIGDEDNPLNLLYGVVLLVALAGAIGAGFRSPGMARAMLAAAAASLLVGVIAVIVGSDDPPGRIGQVLVNGFFVMLFAGSGLLFRAAARSDDARDALMRS